MDNQLTVKVEWLRMGWNVMEALKRKLHSPYLKVHVQETSVTVWSIRVLGQTELAFCFNKRIKIKVVRKFSLLKKIVDDETTKIY